MLGIVYSVGRSCLCARALSVLVRVRVDKAMRARTLAYRKNVLPVGKGQSLKQDPTAV